MQFVDVLPHEDFCFANVARDDGLRNGLMLLAQSAQLSSVDAEGLSLPHVLRSRTGWSSWPRTALRAPPPRHASAVLGTTSRGCFANCCHDETLSRLGYGDSVRRANVCFRPKAAVSVDGRSAHWGFCRVRSPKRSTADALREVPPPMTSNWMALKSSQAWTMAGRFSAAARSRSLRRRASAS
jgi:hypothetical protein